MPPPRITVVTPSYNQGPYLGDAIESVLGQGYPDLEYLVMDGGSTDDSAAVIARHEARLAYWQSRPDGGQARAINDAFGRATGDVLAWLNSDDLYLPGTLHAIGERLRGVTEPVVLFGNCVHLDEGRRTAYGSDVGGLHARHDLEWVDYVIQPSSFWTRAAWERVGPLDPDRNWTFDWEWFIRARRAGVRFEPVERFLSLYRIHDAHKTGTGGARRVAELAGVYAQFHGPRAAEAFQAIAGARARRTATAIRRLRLHRLAPPERLLWRAFSGGFPYEHFLGMAMMAELV